MATVVRRIFRSSPHRNTLSTWAAIVDLLTASNTGARAELESVEGTASIIIGDKACEAASITVTCDGPQTRVYCLFDDDAIDGSDANEDVLGFDPLNGNWSISLPCDADDLSWVQAALAKKTPRVTARDKTEKQKQASATNQSSGALEIDIERLNL
jgi:hypothetical protein